MPVPFASPSVLARLNADWRTLTAVAPDWPTGRGLTLGDVLAASQTDLDGLLAELIGARRKGSQLAGRVAVQACLGRLVGLARRDSRIGLDDAVAAFWLRLAAYPLERRPCRIAANLILDTRKDILAERRPLACLPAVAPPDVTADQVLRAARQLGLASEGALAAAESVYVEGLSSALAGERHHVTADAVRWRCRRVVLGLRQRRDWLTDYPTVAAGTVVGSRPGRDGHMMAQEYVAV